jgi:hypothetical protein
MMAIISNIAIYTVIISIVALLMLRRLYVVEISSSENDGFIKLSDVDRIIKANCGVFKKSKSGTWTWELIDQLNVGEGVTSPNKIDIKNFINKKGNQYIVVPREMTMTNITDYQLIMAEGDSMNDEGISNGDMVWIKKVPDEPYKVGDIVLIGGKKDDNVEFKLRKLLKGLPDKNWETCCGLAGTTNSHNEIYFLGKVVSNCRIATH